MDQSDNSSSEEYNRTEQECIALHAVWEMIDDLVNYDMFVDIRNPNEAELMFSTSAHKRLFNILLGDFLSLSQTIGRAKAPFDFVDPPSNSRPADITHLFYLREVCASPKLGSNANELLNTLNYFADWLEGTTTVKRTWFPSIGIETDLTVQRMTFLKICGDIAKHSPLRLSQNIKRVRTIFEANGHIIDEGQAYLALPEFFEWFHANVFAYHSSAISEHLNNLRWDIYSYLQPEFRRAYEEVDLGGRYRFNIPAEVQHPLAKTIYWDLMNAVRTQPYMPRFRVSKYLKMRY